jgi:hypothetical protein
MNRMKFLHHFFCNLYAADVILSLQLMKMRIEWANAYSEQKKSYGRSMKGVAVIEI